MTGDRVLTPEQVELQRQFSASTGCPTSDWVPGSLPCDWDDEPVCNLGLNGLHCNLPPLHPGLHSWEDPEHAARVERFLDEQDAARGQKRRAS